jgi:serine/threonine-protein kinase
MAAAHMRLALDGLSGSSFIEARKHLQLATAGQDTLSERDRTVLAALEPLVARGRPDWDASLARWRKATSDHPNDAELWYLLGAGLQKSGRSGDALPAVDRAIALDPGYTDALQASGISLLRLGRWEQAIKRFDECIASSPTTADCVWDRVHIHEVRGECDEMVAAIKFANARQSPNGYAYRHLAAGLLSTGEGWDAVETALKKADEVRGLERGFRGAEDAVLVSSARGDFVRAAAQARKMMQQEKVSALALLLGARQLLLIQGETGDVAGRRKTARELLAASHSVLTTFGVSPWQDPTPLALRISIDEQDSFAKKRDAWLDSWRGRQDSNAARLWLQGFALPALDERQARAAIEQRPEGLDARVLNRDVATEIVDALVHAKAKHARAKELLERATHSCAWLTDPILQLQGWDALGQVYEGEGHDEAACKAYRQVLRYWGEAKPGSVTAQHAAARVKALRCPDSD